jgi:hypothetical protein
MRLRGRLRRVRVVARPAIGGAERGRRQERRQKQEQEWTAATAPTAPPFHRLEDRIPHPRAESNPRSGTLLASAVACFA